VWNKSISSLIMLVSWEIWMKINAGVYRHHATFSNIIIATIKEAWIWSIAGVIFCSNVILPPLHKSCH
jgi:hypothetical protein